MPTNDTITDLKLANGSQSFNVFSFIPYALPFALIALVGFNANAQLKTTKPKLLNSTGVYDSKADGYPKIAADNKGNCVVVWQSEENLNGEIGDDWDIFFARSRNEGKSWSKTSVLDSDASSDKYDDAYPAVATNGDGTWIAAWSSIETTDDRRYADMDIFFTRSTDNGATWSDSAVLNSPGVDDSLFDMGSVISSDENGNWMVAWGARTDEGSKTLYARSIDDGRTWTAPVHHSPRGFSRKEHRGVFVVPAGPSHWLSYWSSRAHKWNAPEADIVYFQHSADLGVTWSLTKKFSTQFPGTEGYGGFPNIKINDNRKWVAAWDYRDYDEPRFDEEEVLAMYSDDDGTSWSRPSIINKKAPPERLRDRYVKLSPGSGDAFVALWSEKTSTRSNVDPVNIKVSHSPDAGKTWSDPISLLPVPDTSGVKTLPSVIAYAGSNKWVVVWNAVDTQGESKDADIFVATLKTGK